VQPSTRASFLGHRVGPFPSHGWNGRRCGSSRRSRSAVSRVDVLRRRVEVAETHIEVRGQLHFGPPKTKAGRRAVTLPRSIVEELAAHFETWAGPELVFPSPEGGPVRLGLWRQRFWTPAAARAGLPHAFARPRKANGCSLCGLADDALHHQRPLRIHDLRHTAVALWIANGASPKEIAARAGHTSVVTVLDDTGTCTKPPTSGLPSALRRCSAWRRRDQDGTETGRPLCR